MKFKSMGGLTVKNGQLVNDRQQGMTVIQEAISVSKMKHREKKVNMIAEGNLRADMFK